LGAGSLARHAPPGHRGFEAATAKGARLHLRLAVDYSAREAITTRLPLLQSHRASPESFSSVLAEVHRGGSTEVDLLIRTGASNGFPIFCCGMRFRGIRVSAKRWPEFTSRRSACGVKESADGNALAVHCRMPSRVI